MTSDWDKVIDSLSTITVTSHPNNDPVSIHGSAPQVTCIGIGTDAAVFQSALAPSFAFKKYAKENIAKVDVEASVYQTLGQSFYFSTCFAAYEDTLVLSFEEGKTLLDCVLQGIHIPKQVIKDVEDAREFIHTKGLHPRDIHLKNIILQKGRAKLLDVSAYIRPCNDFRWEHLKQGYDQCYHVIDGKPVPFWLVRTIQRWYNQKSARRYPQEDFIKTVISYFHKS
ncbi:protein kinase family protein [Alteribacillus iranensis]|uniref:Serine/threonine protein kinase n=1 Tax=Alteribacillus iranensis TaxID=930128 RepID=A0A1I2F2S5_9BACI|nr:serine/threonine protein kinase [Alteribacillus iranensis]SFE99127.1 hypothetical protein SAMN05192532_10845 [Alteribacillus iranensis]